MIESNCLQALQVIHSKNGINTEFATIIKRCSNLLVSHKNCSISYVS
jgi:hypothetical protein